MYVTILYTFPCLLKWFLGLTIPFVALLNADFHTVLLSKLTSTNSCLLIDSTLVWVNRPKYNPEKQKSIWLDKIFE